MRDRSCPITQITPESQSECAIQREARGAGGRWVCPHGEGLWSERRRPSRTVWTHVWLPNVHNQMTALSSYPSPVQLSLRSFCSHFQRGNMGSLPKDACLKIQTKVNCFWSLPKAPDFFSLLGLSSSVPVISVPLFTGQWHLLGFC